MNFSRSCSKVQYVTSPPPGSGNSYIISPIKCISAKLQASLPVPFHFKSSYLCEWCNVSSDGYWIEGFSKCSLKPLLLYNLSIKIFLCLFFTLYMQ